MISVQTAKDILKSATKQLTATTIPLRNALGLVLVNDVFATNDIPAFNQSAMDGYAFCFEDWNKTDSLNIEGVVQAGSILGYPIQKKQAVRIFTGAAIPSNTDTVVMQEKVFIEVDRLLIKDDALKKGSNVRPKGSEIKQGELALKKGTKLSPGAIGFLAGIGFKEVTVFPFPKISLVVTGNELVQPGNPLEYGQVYESNSFTLITALQQIGIHNVQIYFAKDKIEELRTTIETALNQSNILLITGGVSVGDYDFVANTLDTCGVEQLFHNIKQKPGKPLFAGKKENKMVFGLPGNPSSVLTCFYEYVVPTIEQMMGIQTSCIQTIQIPLKNFFSKKSGLTHFIKGSFSNGKVSILDAQESYKLSSFAIANCLICLNEDGTQYHAGEIVDVHLLP